LLSKSKIILFSSLSAILVFGFSSYQVSNTNAPTSVFDSFPAEFNSAFLMLASATNGDSPLEAHAYFQRTLGV